ncbi:MAG: DegV family protein [Chloroflexota bacterium]|nr:DegV family protein [Chloroflexota bacterium]
MVKIVTDSSCDLPLELVRLLDITIVPLYIQLGDNTYRDGIDIDTDKLYYHLAHGEDIPKTSAPSPGDFIKVYKNLAMETDQIISIHISSGYSGTCNAAMSAKSYVKDNYRVEVIDSNSVSAGLGLLVIAAARAAQEGKNSDQIIEMAHKIIQQTHMFGKVDNFAHLHKGKRFRLTKGLILLGKVSMALGIKLLAEVYDGGKIRHPVLVFGQSISLNRLKRWAESFTDIKEIAIAYSTMTEEAEMLAARLEPLLLRERIIITRLGCATSTYVGQGTLAMALVGIK